MIKIFRIIRQKVISENRFSKYLLYAIGEIILVVIGILIAVQINNLNQERKNKVLIENYKKNLIEDLTKDSISINGDILHLRRDSTDLANYEKRISKSSAPLDTLLKIAKYEYNFTIIIHYNYNNDTYKVLNSTGNIGLFKSEIINDLNALNSLQEFCSFTTSQSFESYKSTLTWYTQKYPVNKQYNLLRNSTKAADIVWEQISLREHATEFNSLIIRKGDSYRLSLKYLPIVLDRTNNLLAKLCRLK
jgi:hypothetical protein